MNIVLSIIIQTPWYVWFVIPYLVFIAIRVGKEHKAYIPLLYVFPFIFIYFNYQGYMDLDITSFEFLKIVALLFIGVFIGVYSLKDTSIHFDRKKYMAYMPGSKMLSVLFLWFFVTKYSIEYLKATNHDQIDYYTFLDLSRASILIGIFLGRALVVTYRYWAKK